jgi:hypothetical protein
MGRLPTPIYASEALFAYVILGNGLTEELRAIRPIDRRIEPVWDRTGQPWTKQFLNAGYSRKLTGICGFYGGR